MSTLATLGVILTLNSQAFKEGLAKAGEDAQSASGGIFGGMSKIGGAVVAGGALVAGTAITSVVEITKEGITTAVEWAESMKETAEKLGTNSEQTAGLLVLSQRMGINQETLTGTMLKFAKGLESSNGKMGASAKALADLGLSATDSNGKLLDTTTILSQTADKLNAMPDGLAKDRIEMELFGKTGTDMNELMEGLANGGLQSAEDKAKSLGLTMSRDSVASTIELGRSWNELKTVADSAFNRIGAAIIPTLSKILDKFLAWVESPAVQQGIQNIADWMGNLAQTIANKLPEILAFLQGMPDWFNRNKPIVVGVLAALGVAVLAFAYTSAAAFLTMEVAGAPVIAIMAAVALVVTGVYYAITHWSEISAFVKKIWGDVLDFLAGIWNSITSWLKTAASTIYSLLKPIIDPVIKIFNDVIDFFNNIFKGNFKGAWDDLVDIFKSYIDLFKGVTSLLMSGVWNTISGWFTTITSNVANFITGIINKIKNAISEAKDTGSVVSNATTTRATPARAGGGPTYRGTTYMVGENGPELFTSDISGRIIPNGQLSGGAGSSQSQQKKNRRNITDEDAKAIGSAVYQSFVQAGAF